MSYIPIEWKTGDIVTSEKLNKMDNGWSVENTQLFSETVTTIAQGQENNATFSYNQIINSDVIEVTFNGMKYVCHRTVAGSWSYYGGCTPQGDEFTVYPFGIVSGIDSGTVQNALITETAGTYTVAVNAMTSTVSDNFALAVATAEPVHDFEIIPGTTTWEEAYAAFTSKKNMYYFLSGTQKVYVLYVGGGNGGLYRVIGVTIDSNSTVSYAGLSASSYDDVLN